MYLNEIHAQHINAFVRSTPLKQIVFVGADLRGGEAK